MIATSSEWDSLVQRAAGELSLIARMYYGAEGANDYISLSDRDGIEIAGEVFLGVLKGIPRNVSQLDMLKHTYSISGFTLEVDNLEFQPGKRWSDVLEDTDYGAAPDIGFENRKIEVRLHLPGLTAFANGFPFMTYGQVRDIQHDRERTTIVVEDLSDLTDVEIGTILTDADAADTAQGLPEESRGKTKPIIYGDHHYNQGNDSKALDTVSTLNNMVPCVYLGVDSSGKHRWLVSEHKMEELDVTAVQEQIWGWDSSINRFVRLDDVTVEVNDDTDGCIISHNTIPSYFDYWYSKGMVTEDSSDHTTPFTNVSRMGDKAFSLASSGSIHSCALQDDYILATIPFVTWDHNISDDDISAVDFLWYGKVVYADTGDKDDFLIRLSGTDQDGSEPEGASYPDAQATAVAASLPATQAGVSENVIIEFIKTAGDLSAPSMTVDIYECYKRITYTLDEILPLFSAGQAHEYGAWINDRHTDEGYSATHEDDDGEGDLILNPAGMAESLLVDHVSLATARIDEDAFNVASLLVPAAGSEYMGAVTILKRQPAKGDLFALARDSRFYLWWKTDGTITIKVMEDTYAASDRTIDAREVEGLDFPRSPMSELKASVNVLYNLVRNKYISSLGAATSADHLTRYNIRADQIPRVHLDHKGPTLANHATPATNLRTFVLNFRKQPHNLAVGRLGRHHLDLDVGDLIQFSNMAYKVHGEDITANATRVGQTIYPYFWIYHADRGRDLFFKAIQLHDLS